MVLLATLQFLYDGNRQEIFPSTWVVLQLYSPLYVTVALPLFWENQKINFAMRFSGYACSH